MFNKIFNRIILIFIFFFYIINHSYSEIVKEIDIIGNERISDETIKIFSNVSIDNEITDNDLNNILKSLYETNYFNSIKVNFENNLLQINVEENPIVYNLKIEGIKSKSLISELKTFLQLKERIPFNNTLISNDRKNLQTILRKKGYFFSKIQINKIVLDDNKADIVIDIDLGEKSKIKKITFLGDKKFKSKKLLSIIISEEFKFWKIISQKIFK